MRRRLFLKNVGLLAATPLWNRAEITAGAVPAARSPAAAPVRSAPRASSGPAPVPTPGAAESVRAALETDSQMAETHGCWAAWLRESGN